MYYPVRHEAPSGGFSAEADMWPFSSGIANSFGLVDRGRDEDYTDEMNRLRRERHCQRGGSTVVSASIGIFLSADGTE